MKSFAANGNYSVEIAEEGAVKYTIEFKDLPPFALEKLKARATQTRTS